MDIEGEVSDLIKRVAALEAVVMPAQPETPQTESTQTPIAPTPGPVFQPAESLQPMGAPTSYPVPPSSAPAQPMPPPPRGPRTSLAPPPPGFAQGAPAPQPASFEWGVESLLRWAGVILVSLAGIFLVSTAISRGWIGPELQLLGAALGGCALLGGAVRLSDSRRPWALALGCGGAVVLASSALATHEWLDLVSPGVAVVLVAIATIVSMAVALRVRLEGIALVAAVTGLFAPLETLDNLSGGAVLGWIAAFIVGSSALGLANRWPGVRLVVGWLGAAVLMAYAISEDVDGTLRAMGFIGAAVIGATLWAGPSIAHLLSPSRGSGSWGSFDWRALDYRLVALVPAWSWAVVAGLLSPIEDKSIGLVAIVMAVAFGGLAAVTWQRIEGLVSTATALGSVGLLAVGFAIYLDGPALMVALAGQAITSYYLGSRLDDRPLRLSAYVVGVLSSALAVGEALEALDNDGFATLGAGLATLIVLLCWVGAAVVLAVRDDLENDFDLPFVGAWAGTMLWLAAALDGVPQGLVLISVAWAIMACAGLIVGLMGRIGTVKNIAMGTLVITLFKLVTVDMAEVDVFWRVGLFFVVGMGLIALGLKVPSLIGPADEDEEEAGQFTDPAGSGGVTTF